MRDGAESGQNRCRAAWGRDRRCGLACLSMIPVLVAGAVASSVAQGETVVQAATRWGLEGVWKIDCSTGDSKEDVALRYVVRSGNLYLERDAGHVRESSFVSYAELGADGMLELTILFSPPAGPRTLLLKRENANQLLVWSSRRTGTDEYVIKDGAIVSSGRPPPLLTQCSRYGGT
jgi:hypothetical protein